jgi:hypothetical protein
MPLTWENVELRGFEPLTFCMPCLTVSSGNVGQGRVTARQSNGLVWVGLAASAEGGVGALSLSLSLVSASLRREVGPSLALVSPVFRAPGDR